MPGQSSDGLDPSSFNGPSLGTAKSSRDRPWLLPTNRKLRHLQGLSLRNLTFSTPTTRPRGSTIDDEVLSQTWKTPTKLLALRDNPKLEHSKSSSDLVNQSPPAFENGDRDDPKGPKSPKKSRPMSGKRRRRSTLKWTGASPEARQTQLEEVIGERMADTWFSVHAENVPEPIYVSEVVASAMSPNYQSFSLAEGGPKISRLDELTVRFWAKHESNREYLLLIELQLSLRSLQFIGKSLESFRHPLPPNCIVFYLTDGVYTTFNDMPPHEPPPAFALTPPKAIEDEFQPTSSYDALMRLASLDDCIQDALATREKLTAQIDSIIHENQASFDVVDKASQAQEMLATTKRYLATEGRQLKVATSRRAELRASLQARREAMRQGRLAHDRAREYLEGAQTKLKASGSLVAQTGEDLHGQRRRISEDLAAVYSIDPVPDHALLFSIRDITLANSSFDSDNDEDATAAGLGYVAHLTHLLSLYLAVPLPYALYPHGSSSRVLDPISIMPAAARSFPLTAHGTAHYRFDYAVFLLNKDIERLMSRVGLTVLDLRHTLPNLKYLLYVLTATGRGELLPERKAGGVRGLALALGKTGSSASASDESASESEPQHRTGASANGGRARKVLRGTSSLRELC